MIEDLSDDFGVFNGGKYFHLATALWANADVDVEYPFEKPRPGHAFGFLLWLLIRLEERELRWWFWFFGNNLFSVFVVRSQDPMESGKVNPRARHQCCQFFHEFHGCELNGCCAIVPRFFEFVDDLASDISGKSFFGNSRTGYVSADFL